MRCLKKSHGHNLPNFASILNQRGTNPLGSTLIRYGAEILKIVAVSFFVTDHNFDDELTFAAMSWLWAVITWPKIIWTPMCHTYSESWVRALSHGPILVEFFFTKFSRRSERRAKLPKSGKLEKSEKNYKFLKLVPNVVNFFLHFVKFDVGLRNNYCRSVPSFIFF